MKAIITRIVLDFGNTNTKVFIFENRICKFSLTTNNSLKKDLIELFEKYPIETAVLVSVVTIPSDILGFLKNRCKILRVSSELVLPFSNKYNSPNTLGADRIALVSAAVDTYTNRNILVIDIGTCITYDFVNEKQVYLGGAISPGWELRLKSLSSFTKKLPQLSPQEPKDFIGNNTQESIFSGTYQGILGEIDSFIEAYETRYKNLVKVITGGYGGCFGKRLKSSIFAEPSFLAKGAIVISEMNKGQ